MKLVITGDVVGYVMDVKQRPTGFSFDSLQKMLTRHMAGDFGEASVSLWSESERNRKGGAGVVTGIYPVNPWQEKYGNIIITEQGGTCTMTLERQC